MSQRDELIDRLNKCVTVYDSIENSDAWKVVYDDTLTQSKYLDESWWLAEKHETFVEAKSMKIACLYLINTKERYKAEIDDLKKKISQLENGENEQSGYYDL